MQFPQKIIVSSLFALSLFTGCQTRIDKFKLISNPDTQKILTPLAVTQKNFDLSDNFADEQKTYRTADGKDLSYFVVYPKATPEGILIYMHGAGGGMEQGMSLGKYKGNFKNLKNILVSDLNYLYVTPATTDFEQSGGNDLNALAQQLLVEYPNLPIYLAGASAGGRTVAYALQDKNNLFAGVILLCPAISENMIKNWNTLTPKTNFWIVQGDQDQAVSPKLTNQLAMKLGKLGNKVMYQTFAGGDHNAPVEEVKWLDALNYIKSMK